MVKVGDVYETKNYGGVVVTAYRGSLDIDVRFLATGSERNTSSSALLSGKIKDYMMPSVWGVGFMGEGKYKAVINKKHTPSYVAWEGMLRRCYSAEFQDMNPWYKGCSVNDSWHNFQVYAEWHNKQYVKNHHPVKSKGCEVYSPASCKFEEYYVA